MNITNQPSSSSRLVTFKEKSYRKIVVGGVEYRGRDGFKNRSSSYLFRSFPLGYFEGKEVLDLGCAAGAILFELLEQGLKRGVGVEVDKSKLNVGKKVLKDHAIGNVEFFNCGILPYFGARHEEFDCVFLLNVLHHLPDPYRVLDLIADSAREYVCVELPDKAWYAPYDRDKQEKTAFKKALGPEEICSYMRVLDFTCEAVRESENTENFQGGTRRVYLFKKNPVTQTNLEDLECFDPTLIMGPAAAGKTTLLNQLGLKREEVGGKPFKYTVPLNRATRALRNLKASLKKRRIEENLFSSDRRTLYLSPAFEMVQQGEGVTSCSYHLEAWTRVAVHEHAGVLIPYVPRAILLRRLEERLTRTLLADLLPAAKSKGLLKILRESAAAEEEVDATLKKLKVSASKATKIKKILAECYYPASRFSYQRLFGMLRRHSVPFRIYRNG